MKKQNKITMKKQNKKISELKKIDHSKDDSFLLRMPPIMKRDLEKLAGSEMRSLNSEIVSALNKYLASKGF